MNGPSALTEIEGDALEADAFADSRHPFEAVLVQLADAQSLALPHAVLEQQLAERNRELTRTMLQGHLQLRAQSEVREEQVVGADAGRAQAR